jgi:hypothetical protein
MGPLSDPAIPELPGLSSFAGPAFHSASWRHDVDLTGKRVGVIGTGASAIQFVPKIAPDLAALTIFQRTAPWVLPRGNKPISAARQRAYRRVPRLQQLVRGLLYGTAETLVLGLTGRAKILSLLEKQGRSLLERQVPDPQLRATLTPTFAIGCKRILFSTTWYPALSADNATVVPDQIEEVVPEGVRTGDGTLHKLDVLIFGTGFHVTDMAVGERVRGRGGVRLDEAWNGSPQAYLGTTVSGFPNLFLLVGPNTGLGHTSIIYMIESQLPYVEGALGYLAATGAGALEVRREVQDAYNADLQRRMDGTVWTSGGCNSWYLDENGRNSTLWPDFTFRFRARLRKFDPEAYAVSRVDAPGRGPGEATRAGVHTAVCGRGAAAGRGCARRGLWHRTNHAGRRGPGRPDRAGHRSGHLARDAGRRGGGAGCGRSLLATGRRGDLEAGREVGCGRIPLRGDVLQRPAGGI